MTNINGTVRQKVPGCYLGESDHVLSSNSSNAEWETDEQSMGPTGTLKPHAWSRILKCTANRRHKVSVQRSAVLCHSHLRAQLTYLLLLQAHPQQGYQQRQALTAHRWCQNEPSRLVSY